MLKIIIKIILVSLLLVLPVHSESSNEFNVWLKSFKIIAKEKGISNDTINNVLANAKFLPKVIEYDRKQPEFYEDTITYVNKRTNLISFSHVNIIPFYNSRRMNIIQKLRRVFRFHTQCSSKLL